MSKQYQEHMSKLKELSNDDTFEAFKLLLDRIREKKYRELNEKQRNKLLNLYGQLFAFWKEKNSVVNLCAVEIEAEMLEVLAYGLNYHLKVTLMWISGRCENKYLKKICGRR